MLRNLKGFVSNGGAQSLTVFNKKTAQVTDFIQIGKRPRDIALDQRRGWLYVALAGDDLIAVVEVSNGEILGQIRLRFGDEPTELALSASGNRLLALNRGSSSVSIIDAGSLFELGRVRLDSDASDVFVGRKEDRAYVIQPASSSLSVLDLEAFRVLNSITLSDVPLEGVVSSDDKTLYLTTDFSSELLVVDSASLRVKEKIFVGSGARSIKRHGVSGLLYVGKQNGEVAVVDPKVLMAIDSYSLPGPIQSLAIDIEENALFAVIPKSGRLLKLDLVSKRPVGLLELGAESYSVVVMGER
jgi:DNA-binding beta-propeller fold protein YncE